MRDIFGKVSVSKGRLPCEQPFQRLLVTYEGKVAMCCYDWGATHPVGFVNKKTFSNNKDYTEVIEKVKNKQKGFELLSEIKMPKDLNKIEKKIDAIEKLHDKESLMCEEVKDLLEELRENQEDSSPTPFCAVGYYHNEHYFHVLIRRIL